MKYVNAPSPRGTNTAKLFVPADRFAHIANPQGAYDSRHGLGIDTDDPISRVLMLLEARLTPLELDAVKQILAARSMRPAEPRDPEQIGEDGWPRRRPRVAERAQLAFDQRYPEAARIGVEPDYAAPRRKASATALVGFNSRYPDARRIGVA